MSTPDLPNAFLKIGLALAKYHIKKVIGDEALEVVASTLTDFGGEKVQALTDSIFSSKLGKKELLKAAKVADESFKEKCTDVDLRTLFTLGYGDLPSVQAAVRGLPKALDDNGLRRILFKALRSDAPKSISDERIDAGVKLYLDCLQSALLPVKDFGLRVIYNALKEIGQDVKDIKSNVELLMKTTKTGPSDLTETKIVPSRFWVPFPHNPDFVGRDTELAELHKMLKQGQSPVGIRPTVLVGLGGIGKTQLAVEYAHAHRADYPGGIFWLNAVNPFLLEFANLAEKLELADTETPRDKAARKAWDYLDAHPESLVILDNILEPFDLNVPFSLDLIPANLRCRTLFTTRQRNFPSTFRPFEVKVLPEMAAMRLLLRARPEVLEEQHPEWGWARIICASLGWLPLALELSAAYLGAYPEVTLEGYLERLRTEGSLETVDDTELHPEDLPTRHDIAVTATLQAQWNRLNDKDAQLLFRAAGQFSEASWIPIARLGLLIGIETEAKPGYPSKLSVILKKLHTVSLIEELTEDRLRLHPLVQEFAAQLSPLSFRLELAERVLTTLEDLSRLQTRVRHYGIEMVLEDFRTGLEFCVDVPKNQTYDQISRFERILDRQTHFLRDWKPDAQPAFFLQQFREEAYRLNLEELKAQAETQLAQLGRPYLHERFKNSDESPELVRTLQGHGGRVSSVVLSPNGRLAVSASEDHTLKVWDVATGRELRTLQGHKSAVTGVAMSGNGKIVVSSSADNTLKVWDLSSGCELRTLKGHTKPVYDVALSANGQLAVSVSSDRTLKVWNVATGRELHTLAGHEDNVDDVALSANGQLAVSASLDRTLKVWDVVTGHELHTLKGHEEHIMGVALNASGQIAISASWDQMIKVWDVVTGSELRTFQGHSDELRGLALSADERLIVFGAEDETFKIWDLAEGYELGTFSGHSNNVNNVALSADGKLAVTASDDGTLKVWNISASLNSGAMRGEHSDVAIEHNLFTLRAKAINSVALSADGRSAISTTSNGEDEPIIWDVVMGRKICTIHGHGDYIKGIALSADGGVAVTASADKTLKVWNVVTGGEMCTLQGHSDMVNDVALSADGRLAVSASEDKTLKVWLISALLNSDTTRWRELRALAGHNDYVNHVALSADGQLSVSISNDELKVWNVATGSELYTYYSYPYAMRSIALSADGRLAILVKEDNTLEVLDILALSNGGEMDYEHCILGEHIDYIHDVALSADGRLSVTSGHALKVWDVAKRQVISMLPTSIPFYCCAITPDGKTIVAGDSRGMMHILELITYEDNPKP